MVSTVSLYAYHTFKVPVRSYVPRARSTHLCALVSHFIPYPGDGYCFRKVYLGQQRYGQAEHAYDLLHIEGSDAGFPERGISGGVVERCVASKGRECSYDEAQGRYTVEVTPTSAKG